MDPRLANPTCVYWIRKLQASYFAGDYDTAVAAAAKAEPLLWTSPASFEIADYHFYAGLACAAHLETTVDCERQRHLEALATHNQQLEIWADNCSENFENRAALVGAEIARIEGRPLDAMDLYEKAIRSARANGFVHNEGIANELAAKFYLARGYETIAHTYIRNARYCYLRWGAEGKVRQLDQMYPHLRKEQVPTGSTITIGTQVKYLDLATVVKASQVLSGEIVLSKLIETLMRIAVENAGAERGLLILLRDDEPRIEAEATTGRGRVDVRLRQAAVTPSELPESILHYVIRTRECVVLDDASVRNLCSEDEYVRQTHPRSVFCLPIVKQTELVGALYLENNLTPSAFTSDRIAVLELLASQAAISLENARLYADLIQENNDRKKAEEALRASEERWSKLAENSSAGIALIAPDGRFIAANLALQKMLGYTEDDLQGRTASDITHEEDRAATEARIAEAREGRRRVYRVEKRYLRKDGRVMWADISSVFVPASESTSAFFSMVIVDITERKRVEEELHQKEAELAHVSRVTTMGELAASIAHEVNQPLAGIVTNANASLRWLAGDSPNLAEAREAIRRIMRDGNRAGEVVSRMRALFKRACVTRERLDLNEAIEEVVILTQSEVRRNKVAVRMELAANLPPIMGDGVQLQQVVVNLMLNAIEAMSTVEDRDRILVISTQGGEGDEVRVAVRDSGIGFDPRSAERIFDAFHTTKPGGLGMGLSISRSIVESHGGRLWAVSNDGPGATFQFTLLKCQ